MMDLMWMAIVGVFTYLIFPTCSGGFGDTTSSSHLLLDPVRMCRKNRKNMKDSSNFIVHGNTVGMAHRHRRKVRSFCTKEPDILREATKGAEIATRECQWQFRNRRWNCSSLPRSVRRVLDRDTRETAYVHAINSAGVTYAITRACSAGNIQDCPCDRSLSGKSPDGTWEWGGCGDNFQIGYERSKDILDIKYRRRSDIRSLLHLHNNEAGRLAVKSGTLEMRCSCHGLSGSCTTKTCWQKVSSFKKIGEMLKTKFDGAVKVIPGNDGKSIIPATPSTKPPEKEDLVYFEESHDFCRVDRKFGSLGTSGRQCNGTSNLAPDSCDILCCGRGFYKKSTMVTENCNCRFEWCCEVHCDKCNVMKTIFRCR